MNKLNNKGSVMIIGIFTFMLCTIMITSIITIYNSRVKRVRKELNMLYEEMDIDMFVHNYFYYIDQFDPELGNDLILVSGTSAYYKTYYNIYEKNNLRYVVSTEKGQYTDYTTMIIQGTYYEATYKFRYKKGEFVISYKVFEEKRG